MERIKPTDWHVLDAEGLILVRQETEEDEDNIWGIKDAETGKSLAVSDPEFDELRSAHLANYGEYLAYVYS